MIIHGLVKRETQIFMAWFFKLADAGVCHVQCKTLLTSDVEVFSSP